LLRPLESAALSTPVTAGWKRDSTHEDPDLYVNVFDRTIDARWRRTSFTGLTAIAHDSATAHRGTEPDIAAVDDEVDESEPTITSAGVNDGQEAREANLRDRPSLFVSIPGGTTFGSFVHAVFEHVDFTAAELDREVEETTANVLRRWAVNIDEPDVLIAGLRAAIETPLGADLGNIRLADVGGKNRLDEMDFEYALAGGNTPTGEFNITAVRSLLDRELSATDPLRGYLPMLDNPVLDDDVHGFLSGSIDLVLRSYDAQGRERFSVVDYKTNRLGGADLSAWDYRPEGVEAAVFSANYPLQFLLYNVALHRLLSLKLPGYDPAINLGPVKYLFVRGMFGGDNPVIDGQQCGVYTWHPPANVVVALSELIAVGERR